MCRPTSWAIWSCWRWRGGCRRLEHLVYASSSSVYGGERRLPFAETDRVDTPVSLYAATKRADELMSYAYGASVRLPQTGLRFFTVYGPWGRPDMAYYSFAERSWRASRSRCSTAAGCDGISPISTTSSRACSGASTGRRQGDPPPRVLNIGNHRSEPVSTLIGLLEQALGRRAVIRDGAAAAGRRGGDLRRRWTPSPR